MRRPVWVVALALAVSPRVAVADEATRLETADAAPLDKLDLRDGRRIEGHVVERELGRWVVIETLDGYRRMFPWDTLEQIAIAAPARRSRAASGPAAAASAEPTAPHEAWLRRREAGATYEVRASVATLLMPKRTYPLTGVCSTGSGNAPVSMYGQTASDGATGFGGGVGGRFGWNYRTEMEADSTTSWWAFRATSGLDILAYSIHSPTGLPVINGGLCSEVSRATYDLKYESTSSFAFQVPLNLGGQVALGKVDGTRWSGIVLGLAYSPTFIHATPFTSTASSHLNPLGLELTVDFAVMHAPSPVRERHRPPEPHVRAALFFAPATLDSQPAIGTLSIGAVWF